MENKEEQMSDVDSKQGVKFLARSTSDLGSSKKQSILERTLSPRKPCSKNAGKPPKFRTMERSAAVASYEAEIAKKAAAAPKLGMKKLERLNKFRVRKGHLDFDISSPDNDLLSPEKNVGVYFLLS
ncbi:hypothetical protein R1sor_005610 [Riccia sorocarpa]|uniref:Uncharacterized protein n=1 Tax=Riccia sorocarpa TaxID=122646 RepID=A0ABD3HNK0_9MARC